MGGGAGHLIHAASVNRVPLETKNWPIGQMGFTLVHWVQDRVEFVFLKNPDLHC